MSRDLTHLHALLNQGSCMSNWIEALELLRRHAQSGVVWQWLAVARVSRARMMPAGSAEAAG